MTTDTKKSQDIGLPEDNKAPAETIPPSAAEAPKAPSRQAEIDRQLAEDAAALALEQEAKEPDPKTPEEDAEKDVDNADGATENRSAPADVTPSAADQAAAKKAEAEKAAAEEQRRQDEVYPSLSRVAALGAYRLGALTTDALYGVGGLSASALRGGGRLGLDAAYGSAKIGMGVAKGAGKLGAGAVQTVSGRPERIKKKQSEMAGKALAQAIQSERALTNEVARHESQFGEYGSYAKQMRQLPEVAKLKTPGERTDAVIRKVVDNFPELLDESQQNRYKSSLNAIERNLDNYTAGTTELLNHGKAFDGAPSPLKDELKSFIERGASDDGPAQRAGRASTINGEPDPTLMQKAKDFIKEVMEKIQEMINMVVNTVMRREPGGPS